MEMERTIAGVRDYSPEYLLASPASRKRSLNGSMCQTAAKQATLSKVRQCLLRSEMSQ